MSALAGVVAEVETDEDSGWANVTMRSSDLTLTHRFYLDSSREALPSEGTAVAPGDEIGSAHELVDLGVEFELVAYTGL
jgi:hypothetical protein